MPLTSVLLKTTLAERLSNAVVDASGDGLDDADVGVDSAETGVVLILV